MGIDIERGSSGQRVYQRQTGVVKFVGCAFLSVLIVISALMGIAALTKSRDPLEQATIGTSDQLERYERTGDARPLITWLLSHDDTGIGMNTYMTFTKWSLSHQRQFISLLGSLNKEESRRIYDSYTFSLADTGDTRNFRKAYQGYVDPNLTKLKSQLYEAVPWPEEKASKSR